MCNKICFKKIAQDVNKYKYKNILQYGVNDMFGEKFDKSAVEEILQQDCCNQCEFKEENTKNNDIDLQLQLQKIKEKDLLKSIINLKFKE